MCFVNTDNLGLAELASYMNLGKSTVFRLLYTLQRKGYVSKDRNSKYHLSFKFARIGTIVTKRSNLMSLIHPFLMELSLFPARQPFGHLAF